MFSDGKVACSYLGFQGCECFPVFWFLRNEIVLLLVSVLPNTPVVENRSANDSDQRAFNLDPTSKSHFLGSAPDFILVFDRVRGVARPILHRWFLLA